MARYDWVRWFDQDSVETIISQACYEHMSLKNRIVKIFESGRIGEIFEALESESSREELYGAVRTVKKWETLMSRYIRSTIKELKKGMAGNMNDIAIAVAMYGIVVAMSGEGDPLKLYNDIYICKDYPDIIRSSLITEFLKDAIDELV